MFYGLKHLGDKAFNIIYNRFRKPILHYVKARISDQEVAEEITQEIFLKAFRFRDQYEEEYAFSTWLWTIAKNTIADHLRVARPTSSHHDEDFLPEDIPCTRHSAETLAIKKDERRRFIKMMKSLTRLQKRVLWMRLVHQHSYEEISKALGLSLTAVKNLGYRAKRTLTDNLSLAPDFGAPAFGI